MNPLSSPLHVNLDQNTRSIIYSSWQLLDQPLPPTLRDVLSAYKSNGDGDRDMLLAMLQAKSAEDQRIASFASLHRTMLEVTQNSPGLHLPQLHTTSRDQSHPYPSPPVPMTHSPREMRDHLDPSVIHPSLRSQPTSEIPRKRARRSNSPNSRQLPQPLRRRTDFRSTSQHDLPPSPYSSISRSRRSSSSDSTGSQSQHNKTMAIDSLLSSTGHSTREDGRASPEMNTSR